MWKLAPCSGGCLRAPPFSEDLYAMNLESPAHIDAKDDSASARPKTRQPQQEGEAFSMAQALISSRQNVSPKRLVEPGPSAEQLNALLSLAAAAPDHGLLMP